MKIVDYRKGTTFECQCAYRGRIVDGRPWLDSFGITKELASIYGRKPENIVTARGTIVEEDVIVSNLMKYGSQYDTNSHEYFGWVDFEDDGTFDLRMIYGNIKLYVICFPSGPDINRLYSNEVRDTVTWEVIHQPGDRRGMTIKLVFEIL